MATDREPPLYLHVTAVRFSLLSLWPMIALSLTRLRYDLQETQESLDAAKKAIQELIDKELGPLLDQSRFRDRDAPRERVSQLFFFH